MMTLNDWMRLVKRSARLYTIVRESRDREEGVDRLHQGIEKIGLAIDRETVQRVYDRARLEFPAA